jgi:tetratricopeptide (TPR) repeat protein
MTTPQRRLIWIAIGVAVCLIAATQALRRMGKVNANELIAQAKKAAEGQDFKTAGALLDKVLAQEPYNAVGLIERGKLWANIGQFDDAIADWRNVQTVADVASSSKYVSEARSLEGALQVNLHRATAAEQALIQAWEFRQQDDRLPTLELLLRIYVLQMRRAEIKHVLDVIESFRPLTLEEMVLRL